MTFVVVVVVVVVVERCDYEDTQKLTSDMLHGRSRPVHGAQEQDATAREVRVRTA